MSTDKEKRQAVEAVQQEIRMGRLLKPIYCSQCKCFSPNIQGHHEDYTKKLDVIWLCAPCHVGLHAQMTARVGNVLTFTIEEMVKIWMSRIR